MIVLEGPIRTEDDYKEALKEIERLWDVQPGNESFDKFEVLAVLVDAYERKNFHIPPPDPVEAVKFRVEQRKNEKANRYKKRIEVIKRLETYSDLSERIMKIPGVLTIKSLPDTSKLFFIITEQSHKINLTSNKIIDTCTEIESDYPDFKFVFDILPIDKINLLPPSVVDF